MFRCLSARPERGFRFYAAISGLSLCNQRERLRCKSIHETICFSAGNLIPSKIHSNIGVIAVDEFQPINSALHSRE